MRTVQRSELALKLKPMLAAQAKEKQPEGRLVQSRERGYSGFKFYNADIQKTYVRYKYSYSSSDSVLKTARDRGDYIFSQLGHGN